MSVKLIIVALLAAAASADLEVTVKTCTGANCDCSNATEDNTMVYPVGNCTTKDSKHYKVDSCDGDDIVVKQYAKDNCADNTMAISNVCKPAAYTKATCDEKEVKVYTGCATTECKTGGNDCQAEPVVFTINADDCKSMWGKHYKLPAGISCSGDDVTSLTLEEYATAGCTGDKKVVTVQKPCSATSYQMAVCDTTGKKATIKKSCSDNACTKDCTDEVVEFNKYKEYNTEYVFLDTCKADAPVTFQVYAGVTEYKKTCTGETKRAMATCAEATTTSTGVVAPAHTVGVLALALCLLACLY